MRIVLLLAILLMCRASAQPILRNTCTTNNPPTIAGSGIFGTITAQVANYSDKAQFVDTNTLALGVIAYAYDGDRTTIGDGATKGGVPIGFRTWQTPTNTLIPGGRAGELAVTTAGFNTLLGIPKALPTLLWANGSAGTNWTPVFAFPNTNQPSTGLLATNGSTAFFSLDLGTNGLFLDSFALNLPAGFAGPVENAIQLVAGSGGNAFDALDDSAGGVGGALNQVFLIQGGKGGNATAVGGIGGSGGSLANSFVFTGGNGGNDGSGNGGGFGGPPGQFKSTGGNGADGSVSGAGGGGGAGGSFLAAAGNAVGTVSGGSAGSVNLSANLAFSGGSLNLQPQASANGANITGTMSTYAPATLLTVSSSAGPVSTSAATTLLGTAQFLAPPPGQPSGKVLASNVVSHIGRTLRFKLSGYIWTNGTPTFQAFVTLGGTPVVGTGVQTLPSSITSTQHWEFSGEVTFRATGGSSATFGQGLFTYCPTATSGAFIGCTNQTTVAIDTTKDETIDCQAQFVNGGASGYGMQCTDAYFELIN